MFNILWEFGADFIDSFKTAGDWISFFVLLCTCIAGIWTFITFVYLKYQENSRAEWQRAQELVNIIYNGKDNGLWSQQLAIDELVVRNIRRKETYRILKKAESFWRNKNSTALADHIKMRLEPSLVRRIIDGVLWTITALINKIRRRSVAKK